jgi:uncharacterized damage-inducible protein DinB
MALKDALLPEFDHEMGTTRRLLERVPDADLGWKPHEQSSSMGKLAAHLANLPHWVEIALDQSVFDLATLDDEARRTQPESIATVLTTFDRNVKTARAKIDALPDPALFATWTLKHGGHELFTMPKIAVLRSFVMNHSIHHRGQLSVYLRLRNISVPAMYGPSADEG